MRQFDVRIHLDSRLRIGTGLPSSTADDTVVRAADGMPLIPSTTLKGAVRARCADPDLMIDRPLLDRTFGRSGGAGAAVAFSDATPADGIRPVVAEVTTTALTPTRTACPGSLRTLEYVEPLAPTPSTEASTDPWVGVVFEATVRVLGPGEDAAALGLVALGLAHVDSFGADTRRGVGRVRVALPEAAVEAAGAVLGEATG